MIVNISLHKYKWRLQLSEPIDRHFDIRLVLSEVDNVFEHENVVSDPIFLRNVTEWIRDRGFLHPILATKHENRFIIADGTHRTLALRDIKARDDPIPLHTLIMEMHPNSFTRGSWALMFDEGLSDMKIDLSGCWSVKEVFFKSVKELTELFVDNQLGGVYKTKGKVFGFYSTVNTRYDFLNSVKEIDNKIGTPSRYLIVRDAINLEADYLIFAPPKDDRGDLSLLVEHSELRRTKGSRTIIPVRPMFLPIPLEVLKMSKEVGIERIADIIDQSIENGTIRVATPNFKRFDFCGEIWDRYMIIFDLHMVYRCIPQNIDSFYLDHLKEPKIERIQ